MEKSKETSISLLDQVRLQSEVLMPVLRCLRARLGTDCANELVYTAIRDELQRGYAKRGSQIPGSKRERWKQLSEDELDKIVGNDIEFEVLDPDQKS